MVRASCVPRSFSLTLILNRIHPMPLATLHRRPAQILVTAPASVLLRTSQAPADLAGYGPITAAMARQSLGTPDQAEAWLETQGVTPGTWAGINVGWVNRMATNEAVRTRYGVMYSQS